MGTSRSYAGGGLSDWYLPTSEELALMYAQRTALGLSASATYWGSDPVDSSTARGYNMATGASATGSKELFQKVRPIRAFSATSNSYGPSTSNPTNAGAYSITPSVLVLGASRSTANYAAVQYVAGTLVINKITQSTLSISSQNGARTGVDETYTLYPTGGSSTASNTYRVITGGTAGGCTATTFLSASVAGTCLVTVQRAGDNNYHAVIGSTIEVGFLKFESTSSGRVVQIVDTATKPVINSLSASTGLAGDTVTLSGGALTGTTLMAIGNIRVTSFTVVNSTSIVFTVPSGSLNGKVGLRNSKGEIAYSAGNFTTLTAPTLTMTDTVAYGRANQVLTNKYAFTTTGQVDSYTLVITDPLPAGVTFDSSTGQISGTPTESIETTTYTLRAHNRAGTASANFTLAVPLVLGGASILSLNSISETSTSESQTVETTTVQTTDSSTTDTRTTDSQTSTSSSSDTRTQETTVAVVSTSDTRSADTRTVETSTSDTRSVTTSSSSTPPADTASSGSDTVTVTTSSPSSSDTQTVSSTSSSETSTPPAPTTTPSSDSESVTSTSSGGAETTTTSSTPVSTSSTPSETPPPALGPSSESTPAETSGTPPSSSESSGG